MDAVATEGVHCISHDPRICRSGSDYDPVVAPGASEERVVAQHIAVSASELKRRQAHPDTSVDVVVLHEVSHETEL